jgi:hypothetical protein
MLVVRWCERRTLSASGNILHAKICHCGDACLLIDEAQIFAQTANQLLTQSSLNKDDIRAIGSHGHCYAISPVIDKSLILLRK